MQERYTYLIAAAKRSEQARLLNFVRLADYLVTDGLRMVLSNTLEELLFEIRNVNSLQRLSMIELDPSSEDGNVQESHMQEPQSEGSQPPSEEPQPPSQEPQISFEEPQPIVDLVPSVQYFIVELHIKNEILTFDPSYQNYATKVMNHV